MSKIDVDQARGRGLSHQEQDALFDELEAARGVVRAADELDDLPPVSGSRRRNLHCALRSALTHYNDTTEPTS